MILIRKFFNDLSPEANDSRNREIESRKQGSEAGKEIGKAVGRVAGDLAASKTEWYKRPFVKAKTKNTVSAIGEAVGGELGAKVARSYSNKTK